MVNHFLTKPQSNPLPQDTKRSSYHPHHTSASESGRGFTQLRSTTEGTLSEQFQSQRQRLHQHHAYSKAGIPLATAKWAAFFGNLSGANSRPQFDHQRQQQQQQAGHHRAPLALLRQQKGTALSPQLHHPSVELPTASGRGNWLRSSAPLGSSYAHAYAAATAAVAAPVSILRTSSARLPSYHPQPDGTLMVTERASSSASVGAWWVPETGRPDASAAAVPNSVGVSSSGNDGHRRMKRSVSFHADLVQGPSASFDHSRNILKM